MIKSEKEIPFLSIFVYGDHVQCGEKKELEPLLLLTKSVKMGGRGFYNKSRPYRFLFNSLTGALLRDWELNPHYLFG